jgi:hypothetical protein
MSVINAMFVGLLVATIGIAGASAWVLIASIKEMDAGGAWIWGAIFLLTSLLAAFDFWRLL